jgi:hypothetical protein
MLCVPANDDRAPERVDAAVLEMDFVSTEAVVSRPFKITLQPVSRSCVAPANVMPVNSQCERSPARIVVG